MPGDLAGEAAAGNLPQVSAAVLRTRIQQEQDPEKRRELTRRLVILLVSGGRPGEALQVLAGIDAGQDPALLYWKAAALLGDGDYAAAKSCFDQLIRSGAQVPAITPDQISLGLARSLRGAGDPASALALLEKISPASAVSEEVIQERCADLIALGREEECLKLLRSYKPSDDRGIAAAAYLKALATWHSGSIPAARKLFAAVPVSDPWYASAALIGEILCLSKTPQLGIDLLEKHLDAVNGDPLLAQQFLLLDHLQSDMASPDTSTLKKWADDASRPSRARLAAFYRAKEEMRFGRPEAGQALLDAFIRTYPGDPLADQARLLLSSSRLQGGKAADAMAWAADRPGAPDPLRAKLAFVRGLSAAKLGHPGEAATAFRQASSLDPGLAADALFNNAVLAASKDRGALDTSEAARAIVNLKAGLPSDEMKFQIALDLVRRNRPEGGAMLDELAEKTSDQDLRARARLASAESQMKSGRGEGASTNLAAFIRGNSTDPERAEYLEVFLKDTGRKSDSAAVIAAARAFLKAHPDSDFASEVSLKLGEALLNFGDVQAARVEFEQLGLAHAGTDFGRRAFFLAADAAARSMDPSSMDDSLMLLERVAETGTNDQLLWRARLQEGALKNAQNLPTEALAIYDKILSQQGPDAELRAAAMMARADTLHQLASRDRTREQEALATWRQLASDPDLPLRWRNQALCKSALILEKSGQADAALAAYYEAFRNPRTAEAEQLWHDKAGFEAARLLESRQQWNDAVTLYNQILAEGGPRSAEAKARLSKLRLENFLWEN